MTISNNQQITFWLNGVESYNTKVEPQIMQVPYYLPANIADELRVQVKDTVMSTYRLRAIDCDGNVLGTLSLTSTLVGSEYVYDLLTTFGSLGVSTDMKVRVEIITSLFTASFTGGLEEPDHTLDGDITNVNLTFSISGGLEEPDHSLDGELINVVSDSYRLGMSPPAVVCTELPITLYRRSTEPYAPGTTLYLDLNCTLPAIGYDHVVLITDGAIYALVDGVIGADTSETCS